MYFHITSRDDIVKSLTFGITSSHSFIECQETYFLFLCSLEIPEQH